MNIIAKFLLSNFKPASDQNQIIIFIFSAKVKSKFHETKTIVSKNYYE